jgi:hypothetical protein
VGGWWPFLVASLLTYGLLPRLLVLAAARLRLARLLARLPHDDAEVSRLLARLSAPHLETRAATAEAGGAAGAPGAAARALDLPPGGPCAVVRWRDVPGGAALDAAVTRSLGCAVARSGSAGGKEHEEDRGGLSALADGAQAVVVVAEAFEAPDRGVRRLLSELRAAVGPRRPLVVLLVDAGAGAPRPPARDDVVIWREGLAALEDPWLAVEPLAEAGP